MKTSNKLLIGFASTALILPMLVMIFISKNYYVDSISNRANDSNFFQFKEDFDTKRTDFVNMAFQHKFDKIDIDSTNNSTLKIYLQDSKTYGVKIPKYTEGNVVTSVEDGVLKIRFKENFSMYAPIENDYGAIMIYAPKIKMLTNKNTELTLYSALENLDLNFKNCHNISIREIFRNKQTTNRSSKLVLDSVDRTNIYGDFKSLVVSSVNSGLIFNSQSFNEVQQIQFLEINSLKNNNLTFGKLNVQNAKINLSDSTTVSAEVAVLRTLFK